MKYLIGLFFFLFQTYSVLGAVQTDELSKASQENLHRVPEFTFINKIAQEMGVKVYLFGGSAAAYAHYVRWDLERFSGDTKHQPERFDYDFTNIYRGNQDLDLVVDGTAEQAKYLEQILQEEYPHFVGDKQSWEVRLLKQRIGDKLPLLNDPDFKNQHTDSNSTGMLDLTAQEDEPVFRDLLDWDNPDSLFLKDVASAHITYLFNDRHKETLRFKDGKNPPIFSAVRYLAKLTQYEVKGRSADLKLIQKVVDSTNFLKLSDYVEYKLSEFALKTLLNSPDSEYSWNLMDSLGLRKKLIEMDRGRTHVVGSLSWWLNKEPLRTKDLGSRGKMARDFFGKQEIILSHETNSFQAYENITRSSRGTANAFISRNHINGEAAVYGDGFYTRIGREGARETGLTIRFKLHPNARLGKDFTVHYDYVVIKNKKALTLIQENINIELIDFLAILRSEQFTKHDKGVLEKLTRKFKRVPFESEEFQVALNSIKEQFFITKDFPVTFNKNWDEVNTFEEIISFYNISETLAEDYQKSVFKFLRSQNQEILFENKHWILKAVQLSVIGPQVVRDIISKIGWHTQEDVIKAALKNKKNYRAIIESLLSQSHWADRTDLIEYFLIYPSLHLSLISNVFSKKIVRGWSGTVWKTDDSGRLYSEHSYERYEWYDKPHYIEKIIGSLKDEATAEAVMQLISGDEKWSQHPHLVDLLLEKKQFQYVAKYIFPQPRWGARLDWAKKVFDSKDDESRRLLLESLQHAHWANEPKVLNWFLNNGWSDPFIVQHILGKPEWKQYKYLYNKLIDNIDDHDVAARVFPSWFNHNDEWIGDLELVKKMVDVENHLYHKDITFMLKNYPYNSDFQKIAEQMMQDTNSLGLLISKVFIKRDWSHLPHLIEDAITIASPKSLNSISKLLFSPYWIGKYPHLLFQLAEKGVVYPFGVRRMMKTVESLNTGVGVLSDEKREEFNTSLSSEMSNRKGYSMIKKYLGNKGVTLENMQKSILDKGLPSISDFPQLKSAGSFVPLSCSKFL